ncbi:M28 family metallopeptidase [Thermoactinospora rubra]|uniref:M28 family metallopeptidase n=1 Tax=Thermoactinospora rubra TaxID=1088767 RepID=UPI0019825037|nr:M28 family metallopeptidase [Thermoactinospora rubra]
MNIRWKLGAVLAAAAVIAPLAATGTAHADRGGAGDVRKLVKEVRGHNVKLHLHALNLIARLNGNTRVDGSRGFELSRDYVAKLLRLAGYRVTVQPFEFESEDYKVKPTFERVSPDPKQYVLPLDFYPAFGSAEGTFTGKLQPVDLVIPPGAAPNTSTSGCEPADFAGFTAGNWALLQRGSCNFSVKVANAVAAGAAGAVIFNEGQPGRDGIVIPDLGGPASIPVVGAEYLVGEELAKAPGGATVRFSFDSETEVKQYKSVNVLAETRGGRKDNVVMVGGHLDSVADGPGINDNGSGVGAVLETALRLAKYKPANAVRFAFWGGEEFGLLGAEHYVASLSEQEKAGIGLYLNFDMVASPNYIYAVYDGDDSDGVGAGPGPTGSAQIEKDFEAFYRSRGLPFRGTDFDGRSDYGPFIASGIASGGLFTGAEGRKTAQEAALFGGTAGGRYDPCYHQACDDIRNVNDTALDVNADAIATLTGTYAFDAAKLDAIHEPGKPHEAPVTLMTRASLHRPQPVMS